MKKQAQRKNGSIALFGAFVLTLLGLGACMNPLQGPEERSPDGSTGVRISIVTGGERTLLPTGTFSKYVLSFSTSDSVTIPEDVTLTDPNALISLAPAEWTITVTAYVEVAETDVAAAEGSAQVSLEAGDLKGVSIRVSSKLDGANGHFSYTVSYPGDVTYGYLEIYDSSDNQVVYSSSQTAAENNISLAPGYYRMRVGLQTNYGMATRTEILHIYPGMETRWEYAFSEVDFGSPITISGTVDLSGLGTVYDATIILHRYSDFTYMEASSYGNNLSGNWSWAIKTLPFNQPTDLYVELRLTLAGGGLLIKRLPVPITVYDGDLVAPTLGPFTVNQFNLSGVVDFRILTSLGITNIYNAQALVFEDGDVPIQLGYAYVNLGDGSWSLSLVSEEESLPVRILLVTQPTYNSAVYDEIQTTLTGDESDLDFMPEMINAGTTYNGIGAVYEYAYLFVPDTSGVYAFSLSPADSQSVSLELYNAMGSSLNSAYGYPDAALSEYLTAGDVYYIRLSLNSPYHAFQFQVNPVTQAALGGTVDFDDLLASFSGVSVNNASIAIYADNSSHTLLETEAINTGDGSWSATVDLAGASAPVVFVIAAELSNNQTIYHQEYGSISGNNSNLNFSPEAITGGSQLTRTTVNQYDYLLYVPADTGDYSLRASAGENRYMNLYLYDAQTGSQIYSTSGYNGLELIQTLNAGNPYQIRVYSDFETYQFQAEKLEQVTLSGTVNLSGLAPLTVGDISYTEIRVYNGASSPVQLGTVMVANDGSWSALIPASGTQAVRIEALIYLNNGMRIVTHIEETISGDTSGLNLAPATDTPAGGPVARASGYYEDGFLLVPSASGYFNLGAISGGGTPGLYLYDTAGAALAQSSNGSLYVALSAGTAYIVQVSNIGSFAAYQFQMSAAPSMTIGGSVDYSGLPSSIISAISSATVSAYLDNPAHTPIATDAPVTAGGSWSASVPANATGQPVRLVLTLNLNNMSITSQLQTVLAASASNLDFAPSPVPIATAINGKTAANGHDRILLVPTADDFYELQAGSDTYTNITVYDGLTGNYMGNSPYAYFTTAIILPLSAEHPYVIEISPNGNSFRDYQFYADSTPVYSVGLSETGTYHFPGAVAGYGAQAAKTVMVNNAGNQDTGALTIETSGANAASFTVSAASLGSIAVNGTDSFTVVPNTELTAGTYTATITVSGENGISSSFEASFTVTAQAYSIYINQTGAYAFPGAVAGYGAQTVKTVTVRNTGNQATGTLTIETSGANAASFTVSPENLSSIAISGIDSFTVAPNTGLAAGAYTATITVANGGDGISSSFDVNFTVYDPDTPVYTVAFNASGGTPVISTAQTSYGDNTVSLPGNPARTGYTFSGWYTETNGEGATFTGDTPVTADITVYAKWLSANANLASLSADAGWLDQTFSSYTTSYTMTVPHTTTSVAVSATEADFGKASVAFPDGNSAALNPGPNTIRVRVTAEDGVTTRTYTLTVTRTPLSANANLSSLGVSEGTLNPAFSAATTVYTVLVPNGTSSLTVTAAVADTGKAALFPASPHTASLDGASTDITLTVTAEDGSAKEYTLTVNKTTESNVIDVAITIADERIDLTRSAENDLSRELNNTLRLTAPEGYAGYVWRVDGSASGYSAISDRIIELNANWHGHSYGTHSALLEYTKDGVLYGCEVLIRVVR
jgi:uncharacterized repeat protein (TIGR02543 family)